MKRLFFLFITVFFIGQLSAQCNVQTNQREDGVTVRYLRPDRIGYSDRIMFALSMQTNGEQFFVATLSIFQTNAIKLEGNLTLKFANNKSSVLEHYHSELTTFNGYPATVSIFVADKNDLANISTSNVSIAMVQLADNTYQIITTQMNSDILKKHYACLK